MFFIIYIAVIAFALYLIFHDRGEGEGKSRRAAARIDYRPEQPGPVPQTPVSPTPKPLEPAPPIRPVAARPTVSPRNVAERALSWSYLDSIEFDERLIAQTMRADIAGMRHYCSFADVGPVNGYVQPEPGNPHDPRAQVVIRADGKKLGYIPRYALDEYENFSGGFLVCPFSGRVTVDNKGYMRADILVVRPTDRNSVKERLADFINQDNK